jgi:nucleotide-binding universal stress UspA family protein
MRIVLGFDGSEAAQVALQFIMHRAWPPATQVAVVGAVAPIVDWDVMAPASAGTSAVAGVHDLTARADDAASALVLRGLEASADVAIGDPVDRIADRAERWFADLIVVGNRRRGAFASAVFGSVSAHLVDHAPCPVLVARAETASRMLLAADGTPSSRDIPRLLDSWGPGFRGLPVEVLSVAVRDEAITPWVVGIERQEDLAEHERIAESVAAQLAALGWTAVPLARFGVPDRVIVDAAQECRADLIVTGSRGIGTIQRLVAGSVAHDVLLHTRSSVLVMRGHVWAKLHHPARVSAPALV